MSDLSFMTRDAHSASPLWGREARYWPLSNIEA